MAPAKKPSRALGYTRVSTLDQAHHGESLEVQQEQLRALCTLHGLTLKETFVEEGVSGARPFATRPQGARLWASVKRGDAIAVVKLDRLTRSPRDALSLLEACKERGVALIIGDMGGDVTKGAAAGMLVGILSSVAGFERERNGERVSASKAAKRARNEFLGGCCPFAHRIVDKDGVRHVELDTALRDRILDLQKREFSARMIVAGLLQDGISVSLPTMHKFLREHSKRQAA